MARNLRNRDGDVVEAAPSRRCALSVASKFSPTGEYGVRTSGFLMPRNPHSILNNGILIVCMPRERPRSPGFTRVSVRLFTAGEKNGVRKGRRQWWKQITSQTWRCVSLLLLRCTLQVVIPRGRFYGTPNLSQFY